MFSQKLLLPAFAVLSVAAAQSSSCGVATATFTINAQADVTQIADCTTIAGSVVIGESTVGILNLDGPSAIDGSLIVSNVPNLTSLTSNSIGSIATSKGSQFQLSGLTMLSTLQFTDLTNVGTIAWQALPALDKLTFPSFISKAGNVTIQNTFLSTLDGINLMTVGSLNINNNNRLTKFSTQVANITSSANIASNGKLLDVSFPNLIWAGELVFRNVSTVSIPSLAAVNGSLIFDENYFTGISAPNLTSVGNTATGSGSLAFVANSALTNITIPLLQTIGGGTQVANNSALQTISFPVLTTVGGAVDLTGNFTTPSLPEINNIVGALNIESTAQIDCSGFNKLSGNVVQGKENCVSATDNPTTLSPSGTVTGSTSKPSSSKGAAVSYGVNEAVAGLSLVGGIMQMLL